MAAGVPGVVVQIILDSAVGSPLFRSKCLNSVVLGSFRQELRRITAKSLSQGATNCRI
jgi:hypothetical protein